MAYPNGQPGMAALILKGKSFPKVRPADVAHQIYRLKKIEGLKFAVFAAPGTILGGHSHIRPVFTVQVNRVYHERRQGRN
jgi:hypothetical protein